MTSNSIQFRYLSADLYIDSVIWFQGKNIDAGGDFAFKEGDAFYTQEVNMFD